MNITLIKDGIVEWKDQLRTSFELTTEEQRIDISKEMFSNSDGEILEWNDIKMLVFTVVSEEGSTEVELDLGQIYFTERTSENPFQHTQSETVIYPNPVANNATIMFKSSDFQAYDLQVLSMNGEVVINKVGQAVAGYNQLELGINSLEMGIYIYKITCPDGQMLTEKFTKL